jgi:hypothetical protein
VVLKPSHVHDLCPPPPPPPPRAAFGGIMTDGREQCWRRVTAFGKPQMIRSLTANWWRLWWRCGRIEALVEDELLEAQPSRVLLLIGRSDNAQSMNAWWQASKVTHRAMSKKSKHLLLLEFLLWTIRLEICPVSKSAFSKKIKSHVILIEDNSL